MILQIVIWFVIPATRSSRHDARILSEALTNAKHGFNDLKKCYCLFMNIISVLYKYHLCLNVKNSFMLNKISYLYFRLFQKLAEVKKQTVFFLQTAEVWSTSSAADVCRCGSQTADVLPLKKQTAPE
ncbi:hypothetical protein Hanom_Chr12g01127051 [Helianthus anomalus]